MSKLQDAVYGIHELDAAGAGSGESGIWPLARLFVTLCYIVTVVSFPKYDLYGLAGMTLYPLAMMIYEGLSLQKCLRRIWPVLLFTGLVGIANPVLDQSPVAWAGSFLVTGGMISMATLMLKGILSVLASYILVMTAGMEGIGGALLSLHVPESLVTALLLLHRYLIVLLKEVERMSLAYRLRAPGRKGIHIRDWGAFTGQLLLRSMERAQNVYESMLLRGWNHPKGRLRAQERGGVLRNLCFSCGWTAAFCCLRLIPVFRIAGGMFR